jgi:histone H2B
MTKKGLSPVQVSQFLSDVKRNAVAKEKRKRKRKYNKFNTYVYRTLKSLPSADSKNLSISKNSMAIFDSFVNDMFDRVASEAGRLVQKSKKKTLSASDIQTAVKLLLPEDLAKHAMAEGTKAVVTYNLRRA